MEKCLSRCVTNCDWDRERPGDALSQCSLAWMDNSKHATACAATGLVWGCPTGDPPLPPPWLPQTNPQPQESLRRLSGGDT